MTLLIDMLLVYKVMVSLLFPKAKAGLMLNIIGILCINLGINTWGMHMFDLDTFPSWINITNPTAVPTTIIP